MSHIFPGLPRRSLIPIGQLCDEGLQSVFDKQKLCMIFAGEKYWREKETQGQGYGASP